MENVAINTARWVRCKDPKVLERLQNKAHDNLALDGNDQLVYLAPTRSTSIWLSNAGQRSNLPLPGSFKTGSDAQN